jgi:hypothetical protein
MNGTHLPCRPAVHLSCFSATPRYRGGEDPDPTRKVRGRAPAAFCRLLIQLICYPSPSKQVVRVRLYLNGHAGHYTHPGELCVGPLQLVHTAADLPPPLSL